MLLEVVLNNTNNVSDTAITFLQGKLSEICYSDITYSITITQARNVLFSPNKYFKILNRSEVFRVGKGVIM